MIALLFVLASLRLAPATGDALVARLELGQAVADVGATRYEASWLAAIAFRESSFRADAVGDHGSSFGAWQIHLPRGARTREGFTGADLLEDVHASAREALRQLRASLHVCKALPESERLSLYARGSCASERGRKLSRDRWWVREKAKVSP